MHLPNIKISAVFTSAIFLLACATQNHIPEPQDGWRARGKFSFSSNDLKESGNFDWRQADQQYSVRLFGPLGFGAVRINGNDHHVTVRTSREERSSIEPDSLLYQATGMHLPLTELPDWLRGQPSTFHNEHTEFNDDGRISKAFVQGWEIDYIDYSPGTGLPIEIIAEQEDKRLRLIVVEWVN